MGHASRERNRGPTLAQLKVTWRWRCRSCFEVHLTVRCLPVMRICWQTLIRSDSRQLARHSPRYLSV